MQYITMVSRLKATVAAGALALGMFAAAAPATAEVSVIYATHTSTGSISNRQYEAFLEELSERTNGYIKVSDKYHSEALIRAVDMLRNVGRGVADVGYFCTGYTPALLPLTSMMEIPYSTSKGDAWSQAGVELYESNEAFRNEFRALNVELLALDAPSSTIIGANKEIKSAADIKGMTLRAYGDLGAIAQRGGGATPVPMSTAEIFTSMQTGVIDGYIGTPLWMPYPENWLPVTKSIVDPGIGVYYACGLVMNLDIYEKLPDEVKQVLAEMRTEFPAKSIKYVAEGDDATVAAATQEGITFYRFTPEEVQAWKDGVGYEALEEEWIKTRSQNTSADVAAFLAEFRAALAEHEPNSTYVQNFPTND